MLNWKSLEIKLSNNGFGFIENKRQILTGDCHQLWAGRPTWIFPLTLSWKSCQTTTLMLADVKWYFQTQTLRIVQDGILDESHLICSFKQSVKDEFWSILFSRNRSRWEFKIKGFIELKNMYAKTKILCRTVICRLWIIWKLWRKCSLRNPWSLWSSYLDLSSLWERTKSISEPSKLIEWWRKSNLRRKPFQNQAEVQVVVVYYFPMLDKLGGIMIMHQRLE